MKGDAIEKGKSVSGTANDQGPDNSEAVEKGKFASVTANYQGLDNSRKIMFDFQLVVAMLIATVTFAAAFTMPGGYNNSVGTDQGMANFIDRAAFKAFIIFDTTAFCFSVATVYLLNCSIFVYQQRPKYVRLSRVFNLTALTSMALAFATGMYIVLTKSIGLAITAYLIVGCPTLVLTVYWFVDPMGSPVPGLRRPRRFLRNLLFEYGII